MAIISTLLAQFGILWRNPQGNFAVLESALDSLNVLEGSLLVLPEMFPTGFTEEISDLAEPLGDHWEQEFHTLLRRHRLAGLLGIVRRHPDGALYNEALFFDHAQEEPSLAYQKIRLFRGEMSAVSAGSEVRTFTYKGVIFCPLICYDLRFPELFRAALDQGAEVFIVIASWPMKRQAHWELLLQARAVENQAYVIGVNRCGRDPHHEYAGGTMVVNPHGNVSYHAGDQACLQQVDLDVAEVRDWRAEFPAVSDYLQHG